MGSIYQDAINEITAAEEKEVQRRIGCEIRNKPTADIRYNLFTNKRFENFDISDSYINMGLFCDDLKALFLKWDIQSITPLNYNSKIELKDGALFLHGMKFV